MADTHELYCTLMLALFQPWCDLASLKDGFKTFDMVFAKFLITCSAEIARVMDNVECWYISSEADKTQAAAKEEELSNSEDAKLEKLIVTEEELDQAWRSVTSPNEQEFTLKAMHTAFDNGFFDNNCSSQTPWAAESVHASEHDFGLYEDWNACLKNYIHHAEENEDDHVAQPMLHNAGINIENTSTDAASVKPLPPLSMDVLKATQDKAKLKLNAEQGRAY
ncbi:hypothetical protein BDN71DRAFT_1433450 [Pleurotus eryngii]|uniref:Uncharacterized protein n=1 Tax=Pleurotus eryngii TaxID=5323 RepID=A0A9P6DE61_PLEER|nr:hypothetical protein BDN71DRAFT_1433450 [Pleurotus eryngii]